MPGRPTHVRWLVFGLACGTSWLLYLHRYAFALIKPEIAREWNLSKDQLGLLDSAFSLSYSIFQVPLGIAADTGGVRLVLTALVLVWSLGLAMHAWAGSSSQLWYGRAVLGMGQSAGYATLNRISRGWFPPAVRTTLQGFVGVLAGRIGGLSAYLLFGSLLLGVLKLDWRTATYLFAAVGVVHGVLFFALFRNSPEQHPWVNAEEAALIAGRDEHSPSPAAATPPAARMSIRQMFRQLSPAGMKNLAALNVQTVLSTFADNIFSNWIPLFLVEVHSLTRQEVGFYSALPLLGGAIGGVVGGLLNDLCIAKTGNRRWSRSGVAGVGKGLGGILLIAALYFYDQPYVFCGILFFVKFFGDWSITTMWGVVTDIGGNATASVYAFNNAVAGVGSIAAPAIFGVLAEEYGWPVVFVTTAATYVLCSLSWLAVNSTIPLLKEPLKE